MDSDLKQRTMSDATDSLSSSQLSDVLNQLESKDVEASSAAQQLLKRYLQSTRESWLLNGLWDHCMKGCSGDLCNLIANTPDMHSGRLFDKLNDSLMKQKTRLSSLTVLGYLIRQQPTWLYKIARTTLFTTIIRCLKSEHDIPILMNALLAITALLPTIPVAVGPFLPELFYIFMRLMMICSTGYLGHIPEVLIVHLRVGVYSFFHRLYAMYPKNFIMYLQDQYASGHAHVMETQDAIKTFLLSVRLNPQLIVGSQQLETSASKWRGLDAQAIEAECSKLSINDPLSLVDYTGDHLMNDKETCTSTQFLSPINYPASQQKESCPRETAYVAPKNDPIQRVRSGSSQSDSRLVSGYLSVEGSSQMFWSPSIALGLSTPPLSRSMSPSGSIHELSHVGDELSRRSTMTSNINYNDTSHTQRDTESLVSTVHTQSSTRSSAVVSHPGSETPGSGRQSPSKSISLQLVSDKETVQSEGFSSSDKDDKVLAHVVAALSSSPRVVLYPDGKDAKVSYDTLSHEDPDGANMTQVDSTDGSVFETVAGEVQENDKQGKHPDSHHISLNDIRDKTQINHHDTQAKLLAEIRLHGGNPSSTGCHFRSVSLDCSYSLPRVPSTFAKYNSAESISNVLQTGSLPHNIVARPAHMWKGTRGGSFSTGNLLDTTSSKHPCSLYSQPSTDPNAILSRTKTDQNVDNDNDGHDCKSSVILEAGQEVYSSELVTDVFSLDNSFESTHVCNPNTSMLSSQQEQEEEPANGDKSDKGDTSPKRSVSFTDFSSPQTVVRTFSHLLPSALPVPAAASKDMSKPTSGIHGNESGPVASHSPLAPEEILDRLMELGSALHAKKTSSIPMTYLEGTDWSHFGESPQADEVAILKSQVLLLHAQLMYERHHGQQHARRNRSLLSRAFRAAKMEEELWALKQQVQRQHSDIQRIAAQAMFEIDHERAKLDNSQKLEQLLQHQLRICVDENLLLRETEVSAVEKAHSIQAEFDRQQDVLHKLNTQVFHLENSLADLSPKAEVAEQLQHQVEGLSLEILKLNGILDDYKQIERENELLSARLAESEMALSTARNELRQNQEKLQQQTSQLMMLTAKIESQDATMSKMTQTSKQQKKMLESVKRHSVSQLQAIEERCSALEIANQRLEAYIMELYGQQEHNSSGHRIHVMGTGSESSSLSSTPGTGPLATLFSRSPDSYSAIPPP